MLTQINPDKVTPEQWPQIFCSLNTTLSPLKAELADLKTFKSNLQGYDQDWKNLTK